MPQPADAMRIPSPPWPGGPKTQEETAQYEETLRHIETQTPVFNEKTYKRMCAQIKQKNAELHSLRCDLRLKLWVADKFLQEDCVYFPHNLDFRGRAYPIPPNLNHLGSDLCRGLLMFSEAKPLGPDGLDWLKIHLSNLCGHNKVGRKERVDWVDKQLADVMDSAKRPVDGRRWWASAESPFQALAACIEITNAIESGDPANYLCHLPVHQDGSCNGLQHYAALGRDYEGGCAVNVVTPAHSVPTAPADVYSEVLKIVKRHLARDTEIPNDHPDEKVRRRGELARLMSPVVNRRVIKQTVMTSVYGVTRIGARLQVQKQLEELMFQGNDIMTVEMEQIIYECSRYAT